MITFLGLTTCDGYTTIHGKKDSLILFLCAYSFAITKCLAREFRKLHKSLQYHFYKDLILITYLL